MVRCSGGLPYDAMRGRREEVVRVCQVRRDVGSGGEPTVPRAEGVLGQANESLSVVPRASGEIGGTWVGEALAHREGSP